MWQIHIKIFFTPLCVTNSNQKTYWKKIPHFSFFFPTHKNSDKFTPNFFPTNKKKFQGKKKFWQIHIKKIPPKKKIILSTKKNLWQFHIKKFPPKKNNFFFTSILIMIRYNYNKKSTHLHTHIFSLTMSWMSYKTHWIRSQPTSNIIQISISKSIIQILI